MLETPYEHEAAHAVAALHMGLGVDYVEASPDLGQYRTRSTLKGHAGLVTILAAVARSPSREDITQALRLATSLDDLRYAWRIARDLAVSERTRIEILAHGLRRHGRLSGQDIGRLFEVAGAMKRKLSTGDDRIQPPLRRSPYRSAKNVGRPSIPLSPTEGACTS